MYITRAGKVYPANNYVRKDKKPAYVSKTVTPDGRILYRYPYIGNPANGLKPASRVNIRLRQELDGRVCTVCGRSDIRLHSHHLDGKSYQKYRESANNDLSNLITVCSRCHRRMHNPRPELVDIFSRRISGQTFQEIANVYGLTRQRIHQLIQKYS